MNTNVQQNGTQVTIQTKSEATANSIANAARDEVLKKEGGAAGWFERTYKSWGDVGEKQPIFNWISYVLFACGAFIEAVSWSNLLPGKGIGFVLGVVGVGFLAYTKMSAANYAKSLNAIDAGTDKTEAAKVYKGAMIAGVIISALVAANFTASRVINEENGRASSLREIAQQELALLDLRRTARDLKGNAGSYPLEVINDEINSLLNTTALRKDGQSSLKPVRDWIGEPDSEGFCIGSSYYKDTYCPEIIDWKRKVKRREVYEKAEANVLAKQLEITTLRESLPQASGADSLGKMLTENSVDQNDWIKQVLPGVLLMLIIAVAMVGTTFIAKRKLLKD